MTTLGPALIPVARASDLEAEVARQNETANNQPVIQGLASHVITRWNVMRDFKKREIEERLLTNQRSRKLQYSEKKLSAIREQGGSEIYMGVVSTKCRTATAWLRDTLLGTGSDKPWSISATPVPEVPPHIMEHMQQLMQTQLMQYYSEGGEQIDEVTLRGIAADMKDTAMRTLKHDAEKRVDRMEKKMEDQLVEGGFSKALHEFTDDVATFPFAVLKGPVPRMRTKLGWDAETAQLTPKKAARDEVERVDPFRFYWAPWGDDINTMPIIERHNLTREDLESMIGLEGYNEASVRHLLATFGQGGMDWLTGEVNIAEEVTGKDMDNASQDVLTALQLWDSIPGKMLIEWGMDEKDIQDPFKAYPCEVWLAAGVVIKAVLNYDPLGRKPYFVTSFEKVPGRIDGNGVADLAMDAQDMCNASARALANNMGLASGPQVGVNISRLPPGEDVSQMYPWKIWQFKESEYGNNSSPIDFFQPQSNSQELMAVFERFLSLADEVTGIPRYMTGEHVPGAGRTSSGLSMLISNAGKSIKQVVGNVDNDVITPLIERQYYRNLRYSADKDLIGDVCIEAKGAMSLVIKESEAVRKAEFLRLILESEVAQGIVGKPGTAELLRDAATNLNMNVDRLVPSREQVERIAQQDQMAAQQQQAQQQQLEQQQALQEDGSPQGGRQSNFVSARPNGV